MNGLSMEARIFSLHTFSLSLLNQFSTIISMITLIACTYVCNSSNMCMTNLPNMYAHARPASYKTRNGNGNETKRNGFAYRLLHWLTLQGRLSRLAGR